MKKILLLLSLFASIQLNAQKKKPASQYAKTITPADLQKQLYIIAGKEMEGRETGTEGQRKAAAYIESEFKRLGLTPGFNGKYQMPYPIFQDSLVSASIEVNNKSFELNKDFAVNIGTNHTATLLSGAIVYVGKAGSDTTGDPYQGADVKGKIVLIHTGNNTLPMGRNRFAASPVIENAQKYGAAAILVWQNNFPRSSASNNKGSATVNPYKKNIQPNVFYISPAVAEAIIGKDAEKARNGELGITTYNAEVKLDYQKTALITYASNVIGYIEGTDKKEEYVFITAHYDHLGKKDTVIYYGADDDGSGTVSVIELAKAFSKAKADGKGPRRTIVFMTVSGEEKGLWGSDYYSSHPVFPLEKTSVDLNIDMIGRTDPSRKQPDSLNYVYVIGDDKISSELRKVSEEANHQHIKLGLDYTFNDPKDPNMFYYRSDHYNFAKKGVPVIFYFSGTHKDYHRPTDTPDKILYELMCKRAQLVFHTAWIMANRDQMLNRDIPLDNARFIR